MRVIDNYTEKVCEIGLFEAPRWGWGDDIKIRLLELPLVFGELGEDAGFLSVWRDADGCTEYRGTEYSADSTALDFFMPDAVLQAAFLHQWFDPEQPWGEASFDSPLEALKALIFASPRFRAVDAD